MNKINWTKLLLSVALPLGVGALAAILTRDSMQQYEMMYRPPFSPPGWLFPIVWTILFILMGIAAYLILESTTTDQETRKTALLTYAIQLSVNFLWSVIFFNFKAYWLAFAWILLLWYMIFLTIRRFYEICRLAGILLIPYILWVTFAAYLTFAIALGS